MSFYGQPIAAPFRQRRHHHRLDQPAHQIPGLSGYWQSIRQNFVNELEDAAKLGRLALFVELVNHQRREVRDSESVQDAESFAFLQSSGAQNYTAPRVDTLRDTILAEASLKADWLKSALVGPYRSNLFADSAILSLIGGPSFDSEA